VFHIFMILFTELVKNLLLYRSGVINTSSFMLVVYNTALMNIKTFPFRHKCQKQLSLELEKSFRSEDFADVRVSCAFIKK
jgi:hypothetical protein